MLFHLLSLALTRFKSRHCSVFSTISPPFLNCPGPWTLFRDLATFSAVNLLCVGLSHVVPQINSILNVRSTSQNVCRHNKYNGCLPFVRIIRLGRALINGKGFSKITKPTERNGAYHLQFDFPSLFSADERLETGKFCKW